MVNKLTTPPVPPNGELQRGMFVNFNVFDPLSTNANQQALLNFCGTNSINVLYIDMYPYLGKANKTATKRALMQQFVNVAHQSGIQVLATMGNTDWGLASTQGWIKTNILEPLGEYQNLSTNLQQFDGVMLDIEWWASTTDATDQTNAPGVLDLIKTLKKTEYVAKHVGVFATYFLLDSTGTRPSINYDGQTQQAGKFLVDIADQVAVATYANNSSSQISLGQPWYNYASTVSKAGCLIFGAETQNISPSSITYYGSSVAYMNTNLATVSNTFTPSTEAYQGMFIDNYDGFRVMPPTEANEVAIVEAADTTTIFSSPLTRLINLFAKLWGSTTSSSNANVTT